MTTIIHPAITASVKSLRQTGIDSRESIEPETPVLFRIKRGKQYAADGVTAVFPCEPATLQGDTMTCYAHVGQHGACDLGWYNETRAAKPEEYVSLQKELESAPFGYRLKVYKRMTRGHRAAFQAELNRLRRRV